MKDKYIIVEIIPTSSNPNTGFIAQIQALKIKDNLIIKRFDYRLCDDLIINNDLKRMISYDKDMFTYLNNKDDMINEFINFIEDYPLLIIDNEYTKSYLSGIKNNQESIFKYLNLEYSNDIFDKLINKYKLEPSNHLVDLLYEAVVFENSK